MNKLPLNPSSTGSEIFWGEIAPCEHIVNFYETENIFMDSLEGFVSGGLKRRESVVLIATPQHLKGLEDRLKIHKIELAKLRAEERYIALDAEETLNKFMVNGLPDEELFYQVINPILARSRKYGDRVLAFGEMVAILWAQGHHEATVELEKIWHKFCQVDGVSLFCAYPKIGLTGTMSDSLNDICNAHSKVYVDTILTKAFSFN